MSYSHSWEQTFQRGSDASASYTETVTASAEANVDETIGVDAANFLINLAIDISALKSIYMLASKNMTIYTNDLSSGAPDHTISLVANVPYRWTTASPGASPFAGDASDVTKIYVTGAGASGTLKINILQDATP